MTVYQICGIAFCAVFACLIPGIRHTEYAMGIRIVFSVMIFALCVSLLRPYLTLLEGMTEKTGVKEYFPTLLRAVGIALLTEVTSAVCRDAGEESVAKSIELLAKAEILVLSFPLIYKLLSTVDALLGLL